MNPRCAPQRVGSRHLSNTGSNLTIDRWTALGSGFRTWGPAAAKPVAMPATVSGCTRTNAVRQFRQTWADVIQNRRSRAARLGRLAVCWRGSTCVRATLREWVAPYHGGRPTPAWDRAFPDPPLKRIPGAGGPPSTSGGPSVSSTPILAGRDHECGLERAALRPGT
jgi:hypothetical protein